MEAMEIAGIVMIAVSIIGAIALDVIKATKLKGEKMSKKEETVLTVREAEKLIETFIKKPTRIEVK